MWDPLHTQTQTHTCEGFPVHWWVHFEQTFDFLFIRTPLMSMLLATKLCTFQMHTVMVIQQNAVYKGQKACCIIIYSRSTFTKWCIANFFTDKNFSFKCENILARLWSFKQKRGKKKNEGIKTSRLQYLETQLHSCKQCTFVGMHTFMLCSPLHTVTRSVFYFSPSTDLLPQLFSMIVHVHLN